MDQQDTLRSFEKQARQLETLDRLAQRFGSTLSGALSAGTSSGRDLSSVLDRIGATLASTLARGLGSGASSAFETLLKGAAQSLVSSLGSIGFGGLLPFGRGGVVAGGTVQPFAEGGIIAAPTYFPMRGRLGLMGERGAEAIMPLARGPDGRLGVQAGGGAAPQVHVTIQAADLPSFRGSEAQIAAALARAVARGRRAL
ncbi:hypothetical protein EV668_3446 [Enterovirga rhinocerotis]|uniref:Lambda family phage tail tape measure protein n=2 Tax=Enterovirga rhinocerotis TaxID=1339210 RepID=A0A4R7BTY3_9HYPH|nr:hypothetical protein EV668_3446 [Enterovirga rhinocerotis]